MKFIGNQIKFMFNKKATIICMLILLAVVLTNYISNIFTYAGTDVIVTYHPMKLLVLHEDNAFSGYYMQIFSLIVVIPAAFSLYNDKSTGTQLFLVSRVGKNTYFIGKYVAAFIVTFVTLTLPFIIEIILNCIAFPTGAGLDPSNISAFTTNYSSMVNNFMFEQLYSLNVYLYAIVECIFLGITASILACFAMMLSSFEIFKYKIFIFLPVYILLNGLNYISAFLKTEKYSYYGFNLQFFNSADKLSGEFWILLAIVFAVSIIIIVRECNKDIINI